MSRGCPTTTPATDSMSGGIVTTSISLADDGEYAALLNGKDLTVHLNPTASGFKEVQIVKVKEAGCRFLKISRPRFDVSYAHDSTIQDTSSRRLLCASDSRILVWNLEQLEQQVEIENIEPGALNIDFGADENEVIFFHAWNTKLTIFGLDNGRSHVIKNPKFSHYNGFGYRPQTGQLAILLKPDANDTLTIHESRSYELIGREVLSTVDAQGLKWSPDGRWIAIWDAASTGTKVLIFTADGQFFRSYTGLPESDGALDLGVRGIEWSPAAAHGSRSEILAVGKVDGTVDLLRSKTFTCLATLSHIFQIEQHSPCIWRERYAVGGMSLEYTESSSSSSFTTIPDTSTTLRGVSMMGFSHNGALLSTVDQTRPNIVWIWDLADTPLLISALVHEHAVRHVVWHHSNTQLLITTANGALPTVRNWSPHRPPYIVRVPVSRNESGRFDVRWLSSDGSESSRFWFGTPDDYVLGYIDPEEHGTARFQCFNTLTGQVAPGSHGAFMSR
ncbi:Quino protein amine dehydrogenase [Aspergillus lucknowensis]|uniref:Quino protein amine dehydrogenase n=1 Tax=Aspergillus lucknowensis TaxID=176173 RepID=A0ABR4M5E9_9EURO